MSDWTKDFDFDFMRDDWPGQVWAAKALFQQELRGGPTSHYSSHSGVLLGTLNGFLAKAKALGGRLVYLNYNKDSLHTPSSGYLVWPSGMMNFELSWRQEFLVGMRTNDLTLFLSVMDLVDKELDEKHEGEVSVITSGPDGLRLRSLGVATVPLEPDNYTPGVVADFNHVVSDLALASPCGRISILDGVPGSGKTFLVRAMMGMAPGVKFVILPADMVSSVNGPDLLNLLLNTRSNEGGAHPIAMIIEDADSCLVSRGADNIGSISSLLNMGDGLLGAMLDLRIIATTNAGHLRDNTEIDPAISRSGRLCRRIHVDKLGVDQACRRYEALTGTTGPFSEPATLADIYRAARNGKVPSQESNRKGVGFSSDKGNQ